MKRLAPCCSGCVDGWGAAMPEYTVATLAAMVVVVFAEHDTAPTGIYTSTDCLCAGGALRIPPWARTGPST